MITRQPLTLTTEDITRLSSAWQPIETAPKDGEFLVYIPSGPFCKIQSTFYRPNVQIIGYHFAFDVDKPTHWMPLPDPPETA